MDSCESSINHPQIKAQMCYSDWTNVVTTLAKLIDTVDESETSVVYEQFRVLSQDEILSRLLSLTSRGFLETTAMDKPKLAHWAELTLNNHVTPQRYEPSGCTLVIDVFYCDSSDAFHAKTDKDMMDKHLHYWQQ